MWERDNFTCQRCGSRSRLSVDHIHPECFGGTLDLDNLQTLCRTCNARKAATLPAKETSVNEVAMTPLQIARTERLMSIRELARRADVTPQTIINIERGTHTPQLATMRYILNALGLTDHREIDEFAVAADKRLRKPIAAPPPATEGKG